jgi:hypothetical protein
VSITTTDDVRNGDPRRGLVRRATVAGGLVTLVLGGLFSSGRGGPKARGRSAICRGLVLVAAVLVGAVGVGHSVGTATQQATPAATAGHPLVGTWIVDPEVDDPTNPPSFDAFMADGTLVNIGSDGASVGAWEATGARTATFTFAGVAQEAGSEAVFIIRGHLEVDESGDTITGSHSFTLVAADGTVLMAAQGGQPTARASMPSRWRQEGIRCLGS